MLLGGQSVHEASLLAQAAQIRGAIELLKLEHRAVLSTIQYGSQQYHENSSTWNQTPPTSQHQPNTTSLSNSSIQQFPFGSTPLMWNAPRISSIDLGRQPSHRDQDIVSPMPTVAADPRYPCDIAVSDHPACAGAVLGGWPVPGRAAPPWISSAWGRGETSDAADGRGFGAGPDFRRGAQRRPEVGNETASDAAAAPESERRPPGRPAHQAGKAILDAARQHRRVVQIGTQRRSTPHLIEARDRGICMSLTASELAAEQEEALRASKGRLRRELSSFAVLMTVVSS